MNQSYQAFRKLLWLLALLCPWRRAQAPCLEGARSWRQTGREGAWPRPVAQSSGCLEVTHPPGCTFQAGADVTWRGSCLPIMKKHSGVCPIWCPYYKYKCNYTVFSISTPEKGGWGV